MTHPSDTEETDALRAVINRLTGILNTPSFDPFLDSVKAEAAHQTWRWGPEHDAQKDPHAWFWTVGYLVGKALQAHITGDRNKALHHTISTAAVLLHWHQAIKQQQDFHQQPCRQPLRAKPSFWQRLKLPISTGAALGAIASSLTILIYGKEPPAYLLIAAVAASSVLIPLLTTFVSHRLGR